MVTARATRRPQTLLLVVGVLVGMVSCGSGASSGSPTAPTPAPGGSAPPGPGGPAPPGSGSACRTYSTDDVWSVTTTIFATGAVTTGTRTMRCAFNRSTNELTCNIEYVDPRPFGSFTSVGVFRYASVGDFVGDAPRIFWYSTRDARIMSVSGTTTSSGTSASYEATHTYDGDRRLTRIDGRTNAGGTNTEIFTTWDEFGRPTAGRSNNDTITISYNDADRSITFTNVTNGATLTKRFDANGIEIGQTSRSAGGTTIETATIRSTATVCR
jgi:hypothetical protein